MKITYSSMCSMKNNIFYTDNIHFTSDGEISSYEKYGNGISHVAFVGYVEEVTLDVKENRMMRIMMHDGRRLFCTKELYFTPCPEEFNIEGYCIEDEGEAFMVFEDIYGMPHAVGIDDVDEITVVDKDFAKKMYE